MGGWQLLSAKPFENQTNENLITYCWSKGEERHLVVVNPTSHFSQARIPLGSLTEGSATTRWRLTDLLNGSTYDRNGDEMADPGLHVILDGFQSHIFVVEALSS